MTEYVTKALSIIKAVDAVHNCLVAHLPATLERYECDEEGLALPAPTKYALALSPTAIEETLLNAHVAVWIFQSTPSELYELSSGTPNYKIGKQRSFIECRIAYNLTSNITYKPEGYTDTLGPHDILARRGYYYVGAMIDCILTKLCCTAPSGVINQVTDISNDFAGSVFEFGTQKFAGLASVVFELDQTVRIPVCGTP